MISFLKSPLMVSLLLVTTIVSASVAEDKGLEVEGYKSTMNGIDLTARRVLPDDDIHIPNCIEGCSYEDFYLVLDCPPNSDALPLCSCDMFQSHGGTKCNDCNTCGTVGFDCSNVDPDFECEGTDFCGQNSCAPPPPPRTPPPTMPPTPPPTSPSTLLPTAVSTPPPTLLSTTPLESTPPPVKILTLGPTERTTPGPSQEFLFQSSARKSPLTNHLTTILVVGSALFVVAWF